MSNPTHPEISHCLNCDHPLKPEDHYCPNCGQEKKPPAPKFKQLVTDFLGDFFSFDSKFFRSLRPLLLHPGRMTKDYLEGKQIRYIPPLRLFLFLSVVLAIVLSVGSRIRDFKILPNVDVTGSAGDSLGTITIDSILAQESDSTILEKNAPDEGSVRAIVEMMDDYDAKAIVDSVLPDANLFVRLMVMQSIKYRQTKGKGFTGYLISNLTIFLVITLFALAIWLALLNIRHKRSFLEHLIHSVHMHAFLIVAFILMHLLFLATGWSIYLMIAIPFAWYFWRSIKTVYGQGKWKTLGKASLGYLVYTFVIFPVTFGVMLLISFLLF